MAEPLVTVVTGLDEDAASGSAADFFASFAAEIDDAELGALPASEALVLLLDLDDAE